MASSTCNPTRHECPESAYVKACPRSREPFITGPLLLLQTGERERSMQQQDQQEHQPDGPTTGPIRPLIVVMETTGEEESPRPDEGTPPPQRDDEQQDRLPPVPEEESGTLPA